MKLPEQAFKWINPLVIALLKSPLHSVASKDIMLIELRGRRSSRRYTLPVSYSREGQTIRCFTNNTNVWWRNLRGGARVSLRIRGTQQSGHATPVSEDAKRISDAVAAHLAKLPRDAPYYDITLDAHGKPSAADLDRAGKEMVLVEIALD